MTDPDRRIRVDVRLKRAVESGSLPPEVLVCGPAGTGKTFGICSVIHLLARGYRDLRILAVRQTRASLSESVCRTYEEVLALDGMHSAYAGASRRNRSGYRYPSGSEVVLAGLDDPNRIASTSWDVAALFEAIEFSEEGYETVTARMDRPGRPAGFGFVVADTNPAAPSHFLKKRCDDGRMALWDTSHEANPAMHDGKSWTPSGRNYLARLDRLRGTRRLRYRDGTWAQGEGAFFECFDPAVHVSGRAAYDSRHPVHLAVDSGVWCAAVWFQTAGRGDDARVIVIGDYVAFNRPAYDNAKAILRHGEAVCGGRFDFGWQDPAGDQNSPTGIIVVNEFRRAGLHLTNWPSYSGSRSDGLALVESFISVDPPALLVNPACKHTVEAFANYKRARKSGQFLDFPVERQHPFEDSCDALRGGLMAAFGGEGRGPRPRLNFVPGRRVL